MKMVMIDQNGNVLQASDYYPGGMVIPGRNKIAENYRFGFNGKEFDPEWHGSNGTIYDYGFRIYDTRLARFLSVDPLTKSYPWYTPYQFAGNKPIVAIDLDGLEEYIIHNETGEVVPYPFFKADNTSIGGYVPIVPEGYSLPEPTAPESGLLTELAIDYVGGILGNIEEIRTGVDWRTGEEGNRLMAAGGLAFNLVGGKLIGTAIKGMKSSAPIIKSILKRGGKQTVRLSKETAESVVSNMDRLKHGFMSKGHAQNIKKFKGKNWNKSVGQEWQKFNQEILENADETFNWKLGDDEVIGFYKKVDGQDVASFVYAEGDKVGEYASTFVLSENQMIKAGLK
jgi:RHS repeat-associated protein